MIKSDASLALVSFMPINLGKGIKHPIFVRKKTFEDIFVNGKVLKGSTSEQEVISSIVDHEYIHTNIKFNGLKVGSRVVDYKITEMDIPNNFPAVLDEPLAYHNQLKKIISGERKVGQEFYSVNKKWYKILVDQVREMAKNANNPYVRDVLNGVLFQIRDLTPESLPDRI